MGLGIAQAVSTGLSVAGILSGAKSGKRAARQSAFLQAQAMDQAKASSREALSPFAGIAEQAIPSLQAGATPEGFAQNITGLLQGGQLQPLIDVRQRGVASALSQSGLTRSGGGIQELGGIPADIGLQIEQLLNQRQSGLVNTGLGATQGLQSIINDLTLGKGRVAAGSVLARQQIGQQRDQNLLGLVQGGMSAAGGAGGLSSLLGGG